VAGGGNSALEDALFLSQYCDKVYLVHRREQFRGAASKLLALRQKENVEIFCNCVVTAIASEEDDRMDGVFLWDRAQQREMLLPVAGLFVAVGQIPDNQAFAAFVSLDEQGYILAGEDCKTDCPGIFAAGDCRTKKVRQLTTAAADGAVAALMACEYLEG
jgi:thioredoxin reductase (NADPH)